MRKQAQFLKTKIKKWNRYQTGLIDSGYTSSCDGIVCCSTTLFAALAEASVIVREHTPVVNLFMCLWFNEVVRFTSRDQLSFPYVLWRLKLVKKINMFPVCIRKDLVNSMGHIRKAKPLNVSRLSWATCHFEAWKLCL